MKWITAIQQSLLIICIGYCAINAGGTFILMIREMFADAQTDGRIGMLHQVIRKELTTLFLGLIAWGILY